MQPLTHWMVPLGLVASGLLAGLISERFVLPRLERYASDRGWAGEDLLITSFRGVTFVWFVALGIYLALLIVPLHLTVLNFIHKLLLVVIIPSVTVVLARVAGGFANLYSGSLYHRRGGSALPSPSIVTNLTKLLVFLIGSLIILQSLGIAITPVLTALGVGGLAVALALQETLSDLFSGLYIMASRQIKPGEYIRLNTGEEGYVADITWRSTKIREGPNNMIIVPNSKLAVANITNYYQPNREVVVTIPASVSYESDLKEVERVTLEVAGRIMKETRGAIPEIEPLLRYHTFGETSVNFSVILRAREVGDQSLVKHEFIKQLHKRYRQEGIGFRTPPEFHLTTADVAS
ncbi:MAG TPA: mechanosensitive ion channel family protein [bacterium]|nr:mechanosensitive ion channel family protein [bacterium]